MRVTEPTAKNPALFPIGARCDLKPYKDPKKAHIFNRKCPNHFEQLRELKMIKRKNANPGGEFTEARLPD